MRRVVVLIAVSVLGVALVVAAGALLGRRGAAAPASRGRPGHRPDRRRPTPAPAPAERLEDLGGARRAYAQASPDHRDLADYPRAEEALEESLAIRRKET